MAKKLQRRDEDRTVGKVAPAAPASAGADAVHQAARLGDDVQSTVRQFKNCPRSSLEGFVFEDLHAGSLRTRAARTLRQDLRVEVTRRVNKPHAPADVRVRIGRTGRWVGAQMKSGNPLRAAAELSLPKHDRNQKIVTSNHVGDVKAFAGRGARRTTGSSRKLNYSGTAKRVRSTVRVDGIESDPVSTQQLAKAAKNPRAFKQKAVASEFARAAGTAAAVGAGVSAVSAIVDVVSRGGDMTSNEKVAHVAKAASVGAADGTFKAALAVGVKEGAVLAGIELSGGAIGVIACAVGETAYDLARTAQGKLTAGELAMRTGGHAVDAGVAWGAMEGGAAIGTLILPGIGTAVGAGVGVLVGAFGWSKLKKWLLRS